MYNKMKLYLLLILTVSLIYCEIINEDDYKDPDTDPGLRFLGMNPFESDIDENFYNNDKFVSDIESNPERKRLLMSLIANSHDINSHHNRLLRDMQPNDRPEAYFKQIPFETDITKLPLEKMLTNKPWSGYYWAIRYGILSARYNDEPEQNSIFKIDEHGNQQFYTWKESITRFLQPADYNNANNRKEDMTKYHSFLSASEKYDRLLSDPRFTLTNKMKERGNTVLKTPEGDIDTWMGICHGWAIASYIEPKPIRPVTLTNSEGISITFNNHDIMALASLYWANARYVSNFTGYRCRVADMDKIPTDPDTGLWLDYSCFGLNPATFHIIFTNQIGINDKPFIFEPKVDKEIWNHPVSGYNYIYYHPATRVIGSLDESIISIEDAEKVTDVPFLKFALSQKTPTTQFFVAVKMTVFYIVENMPTTNNTPEAELEQEVEYLYLLELDKDMKIVGGEWRFNSHPNYIYGPREQDEVLFAEDRIIRTFSGRVDELRRMLIYSRVAAARFAPLRALVKYLVQEASKPL
jgi:hypothetical protein